MKHILRVFCFAASLAFGCALTWQAESWLASPVDMPARDKVHFLPAVASSECPPTGYYLTSDPFFESGKVFIESSETGLSCSWTPVDDYGRYLYCDRYPNSRRCPDD